MGSGPVGKGAAVALISSAIVTVTEGRKLQATSHQIAVAVE